MKPHTPIDQATKNLIRMLESGEKTLQFISLQQDVKQGEYFDLLNFDRKAYAKAQAQEITEIVVDPRDKKLHRHENKKLTALPQSEVDDIVKQHGYVNAKAFFKAAGPLPTPCKLIKFINPLII